MGAVVVCPTVEYTMEGAAEDETATVVPATAAVEYVCDGTTTLFSSTTTDETAAVILPEASFFFFFLFLRLRFSWS